ncbi:MAG TPA: riboflavin synthase [Polyangia bacterium]|nr:riboflavin synthase [Polyangia bacterium]HVZ86078.1 riboflavin synthase [Polyangia bacterium]
MFTGIVQNIGTVDSIARAEPDHPAARLTVTSDLDLTGVVVGASIAVDGVCLTVVELDVGRGRFAADLGPETLMLTTLGSLEPGARVHLERPLRLGDELGGHLVTGHVDAVGLLVARRENGSALDLEISVPGNAGRAIAPKGSIAVDGVSLTINVLADMAGAAIFGVTLIPHTLAVTKLGGKAIGAAVNVETDLIAKHVERLVGPYAARDGAAAQTPARPLSIETLRRYGVVR